NAVKYSPAGGSVRLLLSYPPDKGGFPAGVRVEVRDQGPGIPPAEREKIFEKFGIIPMKQAKVSQIGLGLSFSKMAVEALGGRISVTDNEPKGAVFIIEL